MPQSLPLLTQDASKSWDGNLVQLKHRFRQAVSHDSSHAVLKTCVGCQIEYLEVCHWLEGARESADVFKLSQIGLTSQKLSLACFVYSGGASIEVWRACLLNLDSRPFKHKTNNIPTGVTMPSSYLLVPGFLSFSPEQTATGGFVQHVFTGRRLLVAQPKLNSRGLRWWLEVQFVPLRRHDDFPPFLHPWNDGDMNGLQVSRLILDDNAMHLSWWETTDIEMPLGQELVFVQSWGHEKHEHL